MADVTVNSTSMADLLAAIQSCASGNDVIVQGGPYTGAVSSSADLAKASEVVIRPYNPSSPPILNGTITLKNSSHITWEGMKWLGPGTDTGSNGLTYPTSEDGLRFEDSANMKILGCVFDWFLTPLKIQSCEAGPLEMGWTSFTRICVDPTAVYGVCDDFWAHHCEAVNWRIDPGRRSIYDRHPDWFHIRPNRGQVSAGRPMARMKIEHCLCDDRTGFAKGIFANNEGNEPGIGFTDAIIRYNDYRGARFAVVEITGGDDCDIYGNRGHHYTDLGGDGYIPHIKVGQSYSNGRIAGNVMPRKIEWAEGAKAGSFTLTPADVISNEIDTVPTVVGWVDLVSGENVGAGAYEGGEEPPVAPATPATEWAGPGSTNSKDGRFAGIQPTGTAGYDTGVLVIPDDSGGVAQAFALAQSTVVGTTITDLEWSDGTNTGSFVVADPATNGSGWRRFAMKHATLAKYAETAPNTRTGLVWRYRVGGAWSGWSTYTGSFTATSSPPVGKPTALTAGQWGFVGGVQELSPGRFARDVKINITHTGAQWVIDGETTGRPLAVVGTDAGANVYRLQAAGSAATIGYSETRSLRLVYSTDTTFSDPSADAKSFTAPAEPPPPTPYDPGELLDTDGLITVSGFVVQVPQPNTVGAPAGDISVDLLAAPGRATVFYSGDLPPNAAGLVVLYGGAFRPLNAEGRARLTLKPGVTYGVLCAHDAEGRLGSPRHFFTTEPA